jgi:hypothetical protein
MQLNVSVVSRKGNEYIYFDARKRFWTGKGIMGNGPHSDLLCTQGPERAPSPPPI